MTSTIFRLSDELVEKMSRIRLVLMDVDGTLLTTDKTSFENVIDQLRKLKAAGIRFSVATGRTIVGVLPIIERMQSVGARMPPMITYNGAVVIAGYGPSLVFQDSIERNAINEVVRLCRSDNLSALMYSCTWKLDFSPDEFVYSESNDAPVMEFNGMAVRKVNDLMLMSSDVVAILIETKNPNHGLRLAGTLATTFQDSLRVTTSTGRYVEISHPQATKGHAMANLAQMLRISPNQIMTIGDSFNDLEMIQQCGVGVAVANAHPSIQNAASIRCSRAGAEGVVEALRLLRRCVRGLANPVSQIGKRR